MAAKIAHSLVMGFKKCITNFFVGYIIVDGCYIFIRLSYMKGGGGRGHSPLFWGACL